jgi:beta-lactamase superfamily II metal-dependent hydrolase
MKVTFKDVGQGDSILLEWTSDDIPKIGIIDCSKKGTTNPVIDYLETVDYKKIEFIVLSHPHSDHYSGMFELLEYCVFKEIKIDYFYNTSEALGKNYWNYFEIDSADNKLLGKLFRLARDLHRTDSLEIKYLSVGHKIDLFPNAFLECLSPSHSEVEECQRIMDFDPALNKKEQSSAANYLATVFKLSINDNYALLTSDAEELAFQTIVEKRLASLVDCNLVLSQMSHHGSFKNYHDIFWSSVPKKDKTPAVASSGKNDKYKHPHLETLEAFSKNNFSIHCTSNMYGMPDYIAAMAELRKIGLKMDTFSTEAEEYYNFGDQAFIWDELIAN